MNPDETVYDIIVVGGGITGTGVARDAALRGLTCLLLEKGDFASGVTSKSTRLIHGGLRYLANFELDLVAESLSERAILRRQAPHLIRPIPILIPIYRGDAHGRAVVSLGIHLYDLLSHEKDLPRYFTAGREQTLASEPRLSKEGLRGSALFYDHQLLMPERLVMENVVSAREAGAHLLNHVEAERIEETGDGVTVQSVDRLTGLRLPFRGRVLINAAGPWIDRVRAAGDIDRNRVIFPTKGIHLVLPKVADQALFVSSRDNRMFFIIPLGDYSLIGTTDTRFEGDLDDVHADEGDVEYLIRESSRILPTMNLSRRSINYTYAGIRPLAFSGASESRISRKHRVIREGRSGRFITIAGGKLTTYRRMAKDVVDAACVTLRRNGQCITDRTPLPGGLPTGYEDYLRDAVPEMASRFAVPLGTVRHLVTLYGSRAARVLELTKQDPRLAKPAAPGSPEILAQVVHSITEEGARTLCDIILRRMTLGITSTRGREQADSIAEVAGGVLGWDRDALRSSRIEFLSELAKDTVCLGMTPEKPPVRGDKKKP